MLFRVLLGRHGTTIETLDSTRRFYSTEQYLTEETFENNITERPFKNDMTDGTFKYNTQKVLKIYRAVLIPVGIFISCVLAFIMIREIRLYYSASNETS